VQENKPAWEGPEAVTPVPQQETVSTAQQDPPKGTQKEEFLLLPCAKPLFHFQQSCPTLC